jgi:hypothetical protein
MLENVKKIYHLENKGINKLNKNLISSCNGPYIISKLGAMKLVNYIINNGIKIPILEIPLYLDFMNKYDYNPHLVEVSYEDNFVKFYQDNIDNKNLSDQYYFKEENVKIFDDDIYVRANIHLNMVSKLNNNISNNLNLLNNISKLL